MLTPKCKCGREMYFFKDKTKAKCPTKNCGMTWERGPEGFWATGNLTTLFTPIFTSAQKRKFDHYGRYMKRRNKPKGRTQV